MTVEEVANLLRVTWQRVYQLIDAGRLRGSKPGGRDWDIEEESVEEELERRSK